ncbi:MAG: hypothetical protein ABWZ54_08995 [Luteibacter sp.]
MEARDLGDTITLYLPQGGTGNEAFAVFQDREWAAGFASRLESLQFARGLAQTIRRTRNVPIRLRIEDDAGMWETLDAFSDPAVASP